MSTTPAIDFSAYDRYIDEHFDSMVGELRAFCSRPTLAGQRIGLEEGVAMVRGLLEPLGASTKVVPTGGSAPVVLGELGAGGDGRRTLLIYNHYDVQPPEPLELWDSPPYAGEVRDGKFYARGSADDRADLLARVQAIRAYQATVGEIPIRLRWLVEGEEEIGSPNLGPVVEAHAEELRADWCAWEGTGRNEQDRPVIICGLKGMLYVELRASGPDHDAHSGLGGVLVNPAWRLVMGLATLRDAEGNFVMDGLDELVEPPSEAELRAAEVMAFDERALAASCGVTRWQRDLQGRQVLYSMMFEPTANIAGFNSGYSGEGAKTIVPSTATVKMDFRLVPRQTPERMLELLKAHLARRGFDDIEVVVLGTLEAAHTSVDHPLVQAVVGAWADMGVNDTVLTPRTGGSGPLSLITATLGIPTVMSGGPAFAGSRAHSPNESIRLDDYRSSIRYWGRFFARLASQSLHYPGESGAGGGGS